MNDEEQPVRDAFQYQPMQYDTLVIAESVEPKSWLVIGTSFKVALAKHPNAWHRFWCRLFFGFGFDKND